MSFYDRKEPNIHTLRTRLAVAFKTVSSSKILLSVFRKKKKVFPNIFKRDTQTLKNTKCFYRSTWEVF